MNCLLVTGGSRGIGAATALLAAERGWDIAINYTRAAGAAEAVAAQVRAKGRRALVLQADVGDEAAVVAMFAALDREWGAHALAGLVNNAGVVDVAARVAGFDADIRRAGHAQALVICHAGTMRLLHSLHLGGTLVEAALRAAQAPHRIGCGEVMMLET